MQVALVLAVPGVNTFPSSQLAWVNVHSVQEDSPANENCPAGQSVQDVVAPGENFPAGQIEHKPPVPALPGRQETQVPVPELVAPSSHTLEEGCMHIPNSFNAKSGPQSAASTGHIAASSSSDVQQHSRVHPVPPAVSQVEPVADCK